MVLEGSGEYMANKMDFREKKEFELQMGHFIGNHGWQSHFDTMEEYMRNKDI